MRKLTTPLPCCHPDPQHRSPRRRGPRGRNEGSGRSSRRATALHQCRPGTRHPGNQLPRHFPTAMAEPTANQGRLQRPGAEPVPLRPSASTLRTAAAMSKVGEGSDRTKPGDLVFFNTMRRAFSHVGIYLGDGQFFTRPLRAARCESRNSVSYWASRFNGARRVLPENPLGAAAVSQVTESRHHSTLCRG